MDRAMRKPFIIVMVCGVLTFTITLSCSQPTVDTPESQPATDTPESQPTADTSDPDLVKALQSDDESTRIAAIDALGSQGGEIDGAIPALIEQLESESAAVRAHALHTLGKIGPAAKPAAAAIVKLVGDEDNQVRREAVRTLGNIRPGPEVTIPLFCKLLREAEPEVRLYAMDAVADFGKEAVPPMTEALEHKEACYWACLVLAEIGPDAEEAVPGLVNLLKTDDRLEVRREAILALAAIGPQAAPAVDALIDTLTDEVNAGPAIFALGSIGPAAGAAEAKVTELAESADSPAMLQTVSLWALARMDPDDEELVRRVVPRLVEALKSPEPRLRKIAARALIDLDPDPEITRPVIAKAMQDASPEVLNDLLDAVASLGEKAVPRLTAALEHEEVRAKVATIIARIGAPAKAAAPALAAALADDDPSTRSEILFAISAIGPDAKEAVPAVTKLLNDPDMDVRYAACYALGRIGPDAMSAKAELQSKLADDDQFLTMASAWALASIHPTCPETCKQSVPVLIEALAEPEAITRFHAAESLRSLGPLAKPAVEALKKTLEDDDEQVRKMATDALKVIGD